MNKDRKDQDVPNRQSNMEQAEGSRRNSQDDLDRDIDRSDMGSGMGSKHERGFGSEQDSSTRRDRSDEKAGGISNRPLDEERDRQNRLPERGRSQSEEE